MVSNAWNFLVELGWNHKPIICFKSIYIWFRELNTMWEKMGIGKLKRRISIPSWKVSSNPKLSSSEWSLCHNRNKPSSENRICGWYSFRLYEIIRVDLITCKMEFTSIIFSFRNFRGPSNKENKWVESSDSCSRS